MRYDYDMIWYDDDMIMIWYNILVWYNMVWYDISWYDAMWDDVRYDLI